MIYGIHRRYREENLLNKEIESWESFKYALREENRLLFTKMLEECQKQGEFASAVNSKKGESFALNRYLWL